MTERNRDILGQLQKALKDRATREPFLAAVTDFVKAVEYSGGVTRDASGLYQLLVQHPWITLGEVYFDLCQAIGRKPLINTGKAPDETEPETGDEP